MKYSIALMSAGLASSIVWIAMDSLRRWVKERIRQAKVAAKERGDIPADADLDGEDLNLTTELYDYEKLAISVLQLWTSKRAFFILLMIALSLGIAWML